MTAVLATSVNYDLSAYLAGGEKFDATTLIPVRPAPSCDICAIWSFAGASSWEFLGISRQSTSRGESFRPLVGLDRPEDAVVAQLSDFRGLDAGWDGEDAAKPCQDAVTDAMRFVRTAGAIGAAFEPTLHVDGSVILEIGEDVTSLRFIGDSAVIYATPHGVGTVPFDGYTIPKIIASTVHV